MPNKYYYIEMVGRLATDEEIRKDEFDSRNAVFINTQKEIQYKVKSLSTNNKVSESYFTGYRDSIRSFEQDFIDDEYGDDERRVRDFQEYFSKRLFIFTHKTDTAGNEKIDEADVILYSVKIDPNEKFIAIPCFSPKGTLDSISTSKGSFPLYKTYDSFASFIQLLIDEKAIGRVFNYRLDQSTFPEFVIWQDNQRICAVGPIRSVAQSGLDSLILKIDQNAYCELPLAEDDSDIVDYMFQSRNNSTLYHITEPKYLQIVDKINQKLSNQKLSSETATKEHLPADQATQKDEGEALEAESAVIEDYLELPTEKTEEEILQFFKYHSQKNKLFYNPKDIVNFHTALKTGSLVILSGMSGTGKSALVDTYAKALGIEKNVLTIPVRPSWSDDSDLLGYVDLVHMVYRPSDTGFINKLVEASNNKSKLFLICLDEMNLARVEHYFSQFLSILEKPIGSRELVLYDNQYSGQLYNSNRYPQSITIGENVRFIGTVNIDESTYHFSDKVLDRANVISLDVLDYSDPESWKENKYRPAITPEWTSEEFGKLLKRDDTPLTNQQRIRALLWEIHSLIHKDNATLGVGPRIVKSIETYLRNLPNGIDDYSITQREGIDYQISQRILTKIRGPEEQLKALFLKQGEITELESLLLRYTDLSDFTRCRKVIWQKEKELKVYGYCL